MAAGRVSINPCLESAPPKFRAFLGSQVGDSEFNLVSFDAVYGGQPAFSARCRPGRSDKLALLLPYAATAFALRREVISGHSMKIFGRRAANAMVLQTTISIPVDPMRRMGGMGMITRATVKTIAKG